MYSSDDPGAHHAAGALIMRRGHSSCGEGAHHGAGALIMERGRSSCSLTCYLLRNCTDFLACAFEAVFLNGVAQPTNRRAIVDLFTGAYQK